MQQRLLANFSTFSSKDFTHINRNWSHYPGLQFTFQFEEYLVDYLEVFRNYVRNHPLLPLSLTLVYCLSIVRFRSSSGTPSLAIFSIMGSIRVLPELYWMITRQSFFASTCDDRFIDDSRLFLWIFLFVFSKIWEFGDTLFILLRKQKLLTLHWVHHALTLNFAWFSMVNLPAPSRWLCSMNYLVHSFMYTYFAVMASGVRVPKPVAQLVTFLQIAQMTFALYLQVQSLWLPKQCNVPLGLTTFGFLMFLTFWALFVKFFFDKYFGAGGRTTTTTKKTVKKE
ncbi:Elongation of very long chain fatty acids protein 6 [Tyrophagus putrescentiae]|nr:Elongation of very long chain fatty acids protein 6 [Tyrophagus putrescentiae]